MTRTWLSRRRVPEKRRALLLPLAFRIRHTTKPYRESSTSPVLQARLERNSGKTNKIISPRTAATMSRSPSIPSTVGEGTVSEHVDFLDIYFLFRGASERLIAIRKLAKILGFRRKSHQPERILDAALLPKKPYDHILSFHIDSNENSEESDDLLFCHMSFKARSPNRQPTRKKMIDLYASGTTADWFVTELSHIVANDRLALAVDGRLTLRGWKRQYNRIAVSPPIETSNSLLVVCGAEYKAIHLDSEMGVERFRYSESDNDDIIVTLSYSRETTGKDLNPWQNEREQCLRYTKEIMGIV